jgi:hypothetical protein
VSRIISIASRSCGFGEEQRTRAAGNRMARLSAHRSNRNNSDANSLRFYQAVHATRNNNQVIFNQESAATTHRLVPHPQPLLPLPQFQISLDPNPARPQESVALKSCAQRKVSSQLGRLHPSSVHSRSSALPSKSGRVFFGPLPRILVASRAGTDIHLHQPRS